MQPFSSQGHLKPPEKRPSRPPYRQTLRSLKRLNSGGYPQLIIFNSNEKPFGKLNIVTLMRTLSYRILLRKEPEGGYTVLVPSLPGCITYGKTVEDAIEMAKDAIKGYVESLVEDGEEVPVEEDLIECRLTVEAHA